MGDPASVRDPEGRVTTFTYDLRRQRTSETDNAGQTTAYTYDGNGNRTSLTPPEGNTWLYRYDGADRLVEVEDPDGGVTVYTYDGNGNRLTQTDALERTTSFEYDVVNRRTATVLPATATEPAARETYAYDAAGNRTGLTDAKGQTIAWEYDVLDRETLRTYSLPSGPLGPTGDDLQSIATELDPNGNPTRVTETYTGATGTRVTDRTYDPFDRLETVTDPHGETISYAYDPNGNRTRLTDPDGKVTRTSFDALNRTIAVTSAAGVTESTYFRDSRLAEVHYPNGSTETTTYDDAGRVSTIENRQGTTLVSSFQYEYDGNGNRTRQVEDNGAGPEETTYTFDSLDRLTGATYPEQTVSYTYDAVGNRLTEQATDTTGTLVTDKHFTYDTRDRLLALTDQLAPDGPSSGSTDYAYDANGNQTSRTRGGITTVLRYSVRNRLIEVREDGALLGSYLYDHQGLRVAKRSGTGDTVRYVYDDQSVLLQTDLAGTTITKYDYGADRLLSLDNLTTGRQYYLFDALGSIVDLTDAAGAIQARYIYDAWGNHRRTAGTSPNPFGFTGHELDDETGLYYAKARYYDPELGIFLTQDPFEGQIQTPPSLHRYLYAYQNPTVYTDPTGLLSFKEWVGVFVDTAKGAAEDTGKVAVKAAEVAAVGVVTVAAVGAVAAASPIVATAAVAGLVVYGVGQATSNRLGEGQNVVQAVGGGTADALGVSAAFEAATDHDIATGEKLNLTRDQRLDRLGNVVGIAVTAGLAKPAFRVGGAGARAAGRVTGEIGARLARVKSALTVEAAEGGTTIEAAEITRSAEPSLCFVAGTLVTTANGPRPIEQIQPGDLVLAKNEATGDIGLHQVVRLFVTPNRDVLDLTIEATDGTSDTIGVTPQHPFWVRSRGWTPAGDLRPGDQLTDAQDHTLQVIAVTPRSDRETVYNFEVAEVHTYFAGHLGAWVHNACRAGAGGESGARAPSTGPLKNRSGSLDEAASAARTEPYGSTGAVSRGTLEKVFEVQRGKGNFGIGQLTRGQADELGRAFVGSDAVPIVRNGQQIGLRSPEGLRVFRFPAEKKFGQAAGRVQANIEEFFVDAAGNKVKVRNAHIDIVP